MSLDESIPTVRSSYEMDEAVRACAALECAFNSTRPASDATNSLLAGSKKKKKNKTSWLLDYIHYLSFMLFMLF